MPKHDPTWPALVCTRCGGELWVELRTIGTYQTYEEVDCIQCEHCYAEWDKRGTPRAVDFLRPMPDAAAAAGDTEDA